MGLDMYVERFIKLNKTSEELCQYDSNELNKMGYSIVAEDELPDNFESVRRMTVPILTSVKAVDFLKIKRDRNIPDDAEIWMKEVGSRPTSDSERVISYRYVFSDSQGNLYHAEFTESELEEYCYPELISAYCFMSEEVAYWRKNYSLQADIYHACDAAIKNLGYYPMNEGMLKAVAECDPEAYKNIAKYLDDEDSLLAYHEWY